MMSRIKIFRVAFIALFTVAFVGCDDDERRLEEMNLRLDSLSAALTVQKRMSDSLKQLLEKTEIAANYPVVFGERFKGISNPEEYIENQLRGRPELIPLDPVLGGTMEFRKVQVVSEDWVLATYDDGHVEGKSIFKYRLQPDGEIEFTHIVSKLPE